MVFRWNLAKVILDITWDIERAVEYAKEKDIYCGWKTNILEIHI